MKVQIHGWVQDNAGTYHKPGSILTIDADGGEGCLSAAAVDALAAHKGATRIKSDKPAKPDAE